jgi:acetyl esterase/lipase
MRARFATRPISLYEFPRLKGERLALTQRGFPRAWPVYADLHDLPPLLIHVGNDAVLPDDSTRLAKQAEDAGVKVRSEIWEGMWHAWHAFAPHLPEGQRANEKIGEFIRLQTGLTATAT